MTDGFHIGAVVADEHYQESVVAKVIGHGEGIAVWIGQGEVGRWPAEIADRCVEKHGIDPLCYAEFRVFACARKGLGFLIVGRDVYRLGGSRGKAVLDDWECV